MIVAVEAIQPFFSICDSYTSVFIYGMDGLYRAGKMADIMNNPSFRTFFEGGIAHLRDEIMITVLFGKLNAAFSVRLKRVFRST